MRRGAHVSSIVAAGKRRAAFLSMELVLTLPILAVVLLALFEFSILFFARSSVVEASRTAARFATLPQVTPDMVEAEVLRVLSPRLQQGLRTEVIPGVKSGDVVTVAVQVPMSSAAPDLLWPIGYSLRDRYLFAETSLVKE